MNTYPSIRKTKKYVNSLKQASDATTNVSRLDDDDD